MMILLITKSAIVHWNPIFPNKKNINFSGIHRGTITLFASILFAKVFWQAFVQTITLNF